MSASAASPRPRRRSLLLDERGIITGLVLRTAIPLAILGVIGFETTQVMIAQVRAESVSRAAASACANTWYLVKSTEKAENDAIAAARGVDDQATVTAIAIQSNGSCKVTVTEEAKTMFVQRIGPLKRYATQMATDAEIRTQ
jgi:hypothetical protein